MADMRITIEIGDFNVDPPNVYLTNCAWLSEAVLSHVSFNVRNYMIQKSVTELIRFIDRHGSKILDGDLSAPPGSHKERGA